jgi:hypothetical protein
MNGPSLMRLRPYHDPSKQGGQPHSRFVRLRQHLPWHKSNAHHCRGGLVRQTMYRARRVFYLCILPNFAR